MSFLITFHHGGQFVRGKRGKRWVYNGGMEENFVVQDVDRWSYFEAAGTLQQMNMTIDGKTLWYQSDSPDSEGGFKEFKLDCDAAEIAKKALKDRDLKVHLYIEDKKAGKNKVVHDDDSPVIIDTDDDASSEGSEDEAKGVYFSDSEEERAMGIYDGFGDDDDVQEDAGIIVDCSVKERNKPNNTEDEYTPDSDEEYESEELLSSDLDSDVEIGGAKRRKNKVFKKCDFDKHYKFKVGLEFSSLSEFKEVIMEHAVLNGRELKYVKNDAMRARVKCRNDKCGFLALCSRVGATHTYQLKTYVGSHSCCRVFNNKSANSKWVGKVVAERLMSSEKVKIAEIITEVGRRFSAGITVHRAWSGIKMARDIVEGDALKQYTLLWSYCT